MYFAIEIVAILPILSIEIDTTIFIKDNILFNLINRHDIYVNLNSLHCDANNIM